ncbi:MAG: hypothetical protein AB7O93_26885 [Vicinamibacterales bacterium]
MTRRGALILIVLVLALARYAARTRDEAPHRGTAHQAASTLLVSAAANPTLVRARDGWREQPDGLLADSTCPRCPVKPCRETSAPHVVPCIAGQSVRLFSRPPPAAPIRLH